MSVGYRAVLELDNKEDAITVAEDQFRSWIRGLKRNRRDEIEETDWDGPGMFQIGPRATLSVVKHESDDKGLRRLLIEFVDTNSHGQWTTRVYATSAPHSRQHQQVLWFESEGTNESGKPLRPATPNVVKQTLQTVDAYDGRVPILTTPQVVKYDDVDELIEHITDDRRELAIIVAASVPNIPTPVWKQAIASLTRDAVGCASFFVLEPDAEAKLNEALGSSHGVPPGALRTFVSDVDLSDRADGRRHRILTAMTLEKGLKPNRKFNENLVRTISIVPRLHLLETDLPADLVRTARVLQREQLKAHVLAPPDRIVSPPELASFAARKPTPTQEEASEAVKTPTHGPVDANASGSRPADSGPAWLGALTAAVHRILGHDVVDEAAIRAIESKFHEQSAMLQAAEKNTEKLLDFREQLDDQVTKLRRQLEDEQLDRAQAEIDRREAEKKVRSLEYWRDQREDRFEYVESVDDLWDKDPDNVVDILERFGDKSRYSELLRYVNITDADKALDRAIALDEIDHTGSYGPAFWEYILVLKDFMKAKVEGNFEGNLHMYLNAPSTKGHKCPSQRHRSNESESVQTNTKMRRERTFPVPKEVDPSGEVFMYSHFAPTHRDQNAPRMYYYLDLENTKKAYIGYIGVHLTNTKTN